jgi:hypothetical protein
LLIQTNGGIMAGITVKRYSQVSEELERMADGVQQHANDADFPAGLKEAAVRNLRQTLEDKREAYEKLAAQAQKMYDEYTVVFKECVTGLSRCTSLIYGRYGKKSKELVDFGLAPWKERARKASQTPPQA